MQTSKSRIRAALRLVALTGAIVTAGLASAPGAAAADDGVAPVCGTAWNPASDWYGTYPFADTFSQIQGQTQYVDQYFVARGTLHECAAQMYQHSVWTCTPAESSNCSMAFSGFRAFTATAVPNVIDAAGGDDQTITITLSAAVQVLWGQCLPRSGLGTVQCPDGASNPAHSGTILYRVRQADGLFRGPWTATQNNDNPGFQLQKLGAPCDIHATSCTYTVRFTRDTTNLPAVRKDVQLLLQFDVRMMDDANQTGAEIAVPVVVVQQGGGAQPAPGQQPSAGPPTTGGGPGSSGPPPTAPTTVKTRRCVVPTVAGAKLAVAKTRIKAARCALGRVSGARSRTVAKGRVIRTSPKAGTRLAVGARIGLIVSRGRR